ncbi:hypothetical protein U0070_008975, partial [Myodes glareolus]
MESGEAASTASLALSETTNMFSSVCSPTAWSSLQTTC